MALVVVSLWVAAVSSRGVVASSFVGVSSPFVVMAFADEVKSMKLSVTSAVADVAVDRELVTADVRLSVGADASAVDIDCVVLSMTLL